MSFFWEPANIFLLAVWQLLVQEAVKRVTIEGNFRLRKLSTTQWMVNLLEDFMPQLFFFVQFTIKLLWIECCPNIVTV